MILHLALPLLPYREPKLYNDINDILYQRKEALKLYQNKNCQVLIAFGGGSSIDLVIAARVAKENDTSEANPLYPVLKLMDKKELKKFYY